MVKRNSTNFSLTPYPLYEQSSMGETILNMSGTVTLYEFLKYIQDIWRGFRNKNIKVDFLGDQKFMLAPYG